MKAIGIDIGTTSICGVVIDAKSGKTIDTCTKNSNAFIDSGAEWEKIQSVEKIIDTAVEILDSFVDEDVCAIGVTGQMHGIVYTDGDGNAVSPLYTWQDERGNLPYKDTTYAKYLNSFSGYGNVTDFYNRENGIRPENAVNYCTIHDYFVMKLCSLTSPIIHSSDAASFGCYNFKENMFNYPCNAQITTDYLIAGKYKGIDVAVAIGDNQASVFSTLSSNDDVLVNVGTGSQVSIVSDEPVEGDNIETRPYFEGKYLVVGSALCGGRAYSLLKSFYSKIIGYVKDAEDSEIYAIMDEMLKDCKKLELKVDTRFAGTRKDPDVCGSVLGITTENFVPSQITLGVLDGMATELYNMYVQMNAKKCGIVGSGNGVRKNLSLVKIFEKKFGAKMKIPAHMEEAAYGAALFALISGGVYKNACEAQQIILYK